MSHKGENRKNVDKYAVYTIKEWNLYESKILQQTMPRGSVSVFTKPEDLSVLVLEEIKPRYVFFPHWSWIIPKDIIKNWECVVFHLGDVPFGRGGSPLQNHIGRKLYDTCLTALRATDGVDEGPVYFKKPFSLWGGAEEIYIRMSQTIFREMIPWIIENNPEPVKQSGEVVLFDRRKVEQSDLNNNNLETLDDVFDLIRMLDAEGYPKAFLDYGNFRFTFSRAQRKIGKIISDIEITVKQEKNL